MLENQTDKIKRKDKNPFWKGQIYEKLPENEYFFIRGLQFKISKEKLPTQVIKIKKAVTENPLRWAKEPTVPGTGDIY